MGMRIDPAGKLCSSAAALRGRHANATNMNKVKILVFMILSPFFLKIENLVLRARSEMIGSAVHQICTWVSGVRFQVSVKYRNLDTDLVAAEDQQR
jgi:hypothetical protein